MLAPVDPAAEFVGNALCLDFVNTVNVRPTPTRDRLATAEDLTAWAETAGHPLSGVGVQSAAAALPGLRRLRDVVHEVMSAVVDGVALHETPLAELTATYADAITQARWDKADDRFVVSWPHLRDASRLAWPVAASAVDLLRTGPLHRLGRCPGCGWLFLDTSRNGQRRWCSMATCGSRTKSARYYARAGHSP
jgi:predicted RNA-binding Zn ribbon-like protein